MRGHALGAGLSGFLGFVAATAQAADPYCAGLANRLEVGTLYAASCPKANCLVALKPGEPDQVLRKAGNYRFLYLIGNTTIERSVFIVEAKYVDRQKQGDKLMVDLSRDRIAFACRLAPSIKEWRLFQDFEAPRFPADPGDVGTTAAVTYDDYDQYHRLGYAPRPDQDTLDKFHVWYSNGRTCVFTADGRRGPYFLLTDRNNIPSWYGRIATRIGARALDMTVQAAGYSDVQHYSRIEVKLGNYEKKAKTRSCYSFALDTAHDAVDLELVDLEAVVQGTTGIQPTPTWHIDFAR